jgi:hypothetical protein
MSDIEQKAEIIPLPPPIEIRLGSLAIADPKEMIHRASELATALKEIINKQKLFVVIKSKKGPPRKFVVAEGWTTMGAMLGVVPIEVSCDPLPEGKGYKAVIKLVRLNDGMQVGGASAICNMQERGWTPDDAYATHSKAITRATGKAFRLSFAWIMKLAGFEATPAAEIFEVEGSEEQSQEVMEQKLAELKAKTAQQAEEKAEKKTAQESVFFSWPESHNGHKALVMGLSALRKFGLEAYIRREAHGEWNERENGYFVPSDNIPELRKMIHGLQCPLIEKDNTGLLQESLRQQEAKRANGNDTRGKSATAIS